MTGQATTIDELAFTRPYGEQEKQILTTEAIEFLTELVTHLTPQRNKLLIARTQQQQDIDNGMLPDFILGTVSIHDADWKIRGIPSNLEDRRVETIGPAKRRMVTNALDTNMEVFIANFEDSPAPDWNKVIDGQISLRDAVSGAISYNNEAGKIYQLKLNPAASICRVRGLHLSEEHVTRHGETIPDSLFDFVLYFFHNCQALLVKSSGPYFHLPKAQSWQGAAWRSEVFSYVEDRLSLPHGTIKTTLPAETLPAVPQMDEISHTLRNHIAGLNRGRWDCVFSYIKTSKNHSDHVLPSRRAVTMDRPFLNAYSRLLIKICHKRDAFAMGGMAASVPSKDEECNNQVFGKVKMDRSLEANNGHDGMWIAHPGLAGMTTAVFNDIPGSYKNQLEVMYEQDAPITADQLLVPCDDKRTEEGMCVNIRMTVQYIEVQIPGNGCVPIYDLTEGAATAEISRTSIWQWIYHQKTLSNGKPVTKALFRQALGKEIKVIASKLGEEHFSHGCPDDTTRLMEQITTSDRLIDFLTLPGYCLLA